METFFTDERNKWREYLAEHFETASEIWFVFPTKESGEKSLSYNDAVEEKGDQARLHTGYVVQQIDEACQKYNIDISEYGLYCHEDYHEETEEVEVTQGDGTIKKETKVIREASEHYSLRYTEVYAIECAYLRKQIKELKERLEKLEGNFK